MKKKTNISDKTLRIIKNNKIAPTPKWEFVVKNWGIWLGLILCLMFLAFGFGVSWFGLVENIISPYFWIFEAFVFLLLSFLLFENTKRAYRFDKRQVVAIIGLCGIVAGGMIFKIGIASKIDRNFESALPIYRHMVPMRMKVWNSPDQGYLSGIIVKIIDSNNFMIEGFDGKVWRITGRNPIIRGSVQIAVKQEVKLIGQQTGKNTFETEEIRPWEGMRQRMMKEN